MTVIDHFDTFAQRVRVRFDLPPIAITPATPIGAGGLELDSLAVYELVVQIEEWADVLYALEEPDDLATVGAAYDYYAALAASPGAFLRIIE